jgi:hypothetical protein
MSGEQPVHQKLIEARDSEILALTRHARHWRACGSPHGVIRFQHRRKISSILIRNTLVPIAIRRATGNCLVIEASNHRKPGVVVSIIPIDFQRRFERRWAARFVRKAPGPSSQKSEHEKQGQQLGEPAKPKGKPAGPGSILALSGPGMKLAQASARASEPPVCALKL